MSVPIEKVMGINGDTGMPEAYSLPENYGTIAMDAFAGDGAGRFKAGDFLKFASHNKVYMVISDVTSSSNAATVTIEPSLPPLQFTCVTTALECI